MRLFHFSDRPDIEVFVPRAPLRHPDSEPLVYAMGEWHAPLYYFPRDCPRIGLWVIPSTSQEDREAFDPSGAHKMRLFIDRAFEESWRNGTVYRYEFSPEDGFIDCQGYGDWICRHPVHPRNTVILTDLPSLCESEGAKVEVVDRLSDLARSLLDKDLKVFQTTLHVSMVRMGMLPDWEGPPTKVNQKVP